MSIIDDFVKQLKKGIIAPLPQEPIYPTSTAKVSPTPNYSYSLTPVIDKLRSAELKFIASGFKGIGNGEPAPTNILDAFKQSGQNISKSFTDFGKTINPPTVSTPVGQRNESISAPPTPIYTKPNPTGFISEAQYNKEELNKRAKIALNSVIASMGGSGEIKNLLKPGVVPEGFLQNMARETDEAVIKNTLEDIGVKPVDSAALAPKLAKTKTIDEVKNVLINHQTPGIVPSKQPVPGETPQQALARSEAYAKQVHPTIPIVRPTGVNLPEQVTPANVDVVKQALDTRKQDLVNRGWIQTPTPTPTPTPLVVKPTISNVPKDQIQAQIDVIKEVLAEHPGVKLQKLVPDKVVKTNFLDKVQGENLPKSVVKANTRKEVLNRKLQSVFEGTPQSDQFDNYDAIVQAKEEARGLKERLKALQQQKKTAPKVQISEEGIPMARRSVPFMPTANRTNAPLTVSETNQGIRGTTTSPVSEEQSLQQTLETQGLESEVTIPQNIRGDLPKESSYKNSIQGKILNARQATGMFDDYVSIDPDPKEFPDAVDKIRKMAKKMDLGKKAKDYKDISTFKKQHRQFYRNTQQVFGKDFPIIEKTVIDPFKEAKVGFYNGFDTHIEDFNKNIWSKFRPKTKAAMAIRLYGEGKKSYADLIKEFGENRAKEIVAADGWFRNKYDEMLKSINEVEMEIYPDTNPMYRDDNIAKWTPKRKDYYRYFEEQSSDFSKLQSILENPTKIDPRLLDKETRPKTKWASFKQMRLGKETKADAVNGFINYLPNAMWATHIDPTVGLFRELGEVLARRTVKTKNVNNYIYEVEKFADELAGKSAPLDRIAIDYVPGGRQTLRGIDFINNRVKANTILGNFASTVAQLYNIPQGIASAMLKNSVLGGKDLLANPWVKGTPMSKSEFLRERYWKGLQQFDVGVLNNTKKGLKFMVQALDEVGTKFVWGGQYRKAIEIGIENPIKYADIETEKLVGGRGIGEMSLIQNSKIWQVVAPFQYEMTNLWWVMEDLAKSNEKVGTKFYQFALLFASLWLMNNASEKTTGRRIALDPVQATLDGIDQIKKEPNASGVFKAGGRLTGEVVGNLPLGSSITDLLYPEYGMTVAGVKFPTRKEFFGEQDPTRFGGGLLSTKALSDPLYKILPPFAGGQAKKTIEFEKARQEGKSTDAAGRAQFDVGGTPAKNIQGWFFGKYAGEGAQDYYQNDLTYAEATYKNLKNSPTAKEDFDKMIKENPTLARGVLQVIKKEKLGIDKNDEKLLSLGVATKARAKEVAKQFNKLDTKEEKAALWEEYTKKKIITKDVAKQLVEFLK